MSIISLVSSSFSFPMCLTLTISWCNWLAHCCCSMVPADGWSLSRSHCSLARCSCGSSSITTSGRRLIVYNISRPPSYVASVCPVHVAETLFAAHPAAYCPRLQRQIFFVTVYTLAIFSPRRQTHNQCTSPGTPWQPSRSVSSSN